MMEDQQLTEKQQQRYDRILTQAEAMFYEQGFYKLSLAQLTQQLRISRSTIYEYFGSKEGLVEAVTKELTRRLDKGLEEVVHHPELSTFDKFIAVTQTQSEMLKGNCYKLLSDLKVHLPHVYETFEAGRKQREASGYRVLVQRGMKEGLFDKRLPEDFLVQLYVKMGQLLSDTDLFQHISMTKAEAMEKIIRIYLNGAKKVK